MPTVELPRGRVEYRVTGPDDAAAPPVVFVHGLLVDGQLWTGVADRLAEQGIRSYAPTLPLGSHRIALDPDADLTPRGVARLILDFLAALDLTDVTLVGNDTGGALCQFVLDTDATRIGRLVLTNCDAFDQFPPAPFGMIVAIGRNERRLKPFLAGTRRRAVRHSWLAYGGLAHHLDPDLTRSWVEPALSDAAVRRDTAKFLRGIHPGDLVDVSTRLGGFDRPVRLVWGTDDRFFTPGLGRRLAAVFPQSELVEVAGSRTFVALDDPDRLTTEIATFTRTPTTG